MSLDLDIQTAVKADQCADILQRDLAELNRSDNPLLGDVALELMTAVGKIRSRLQATISSLEMTYNRNADRAEQIEQALRDYHLALDQRAHGGVASGELVSKIERIFDMPWVSGQELKRKGEPT